MGGKALHTDNAPRAIGPYSQAKETGDFVYLSGQLGLDAKTGELGTDIEAQTRLSLENIGAILKSAGLTYSDVIKTTIYITDMASFSKVNEIYATYFTGDFPARSCVAVSALPKGGLVEIEAIAAR